MSRLIYPKLSYDVMNVLYTVHNKLGSGLLEKHYQRAIEIELDYRKLNFEREKLVRLLYQEVSIGKYFLDFVIDQKIVLEIKSTPIFEQKSMNQAYSYLRQLSLPLAIVANFHSANLRYKRIVNPEFKDKDLSAY